MADRRRRRGFALMTVLAVLTIASALALTGAALGRDAFHAERNRIALERSWWRAVACAARARASIDDELATAAAEPGGQTLAWRTLDRVVARSSVLPAAGCDVSMEAVGTRVDVNAATAESLDRLFTAIGFTDRAESLRAALLAGTSAGQAPLPDILALGRIAGFQPLAPFEAVLSAEPGRICLLTAPAAVLESIPGFTPAVVQRILDLRAQGIPLNDLLQVADAVPPTDAAELFAHYPEITRTTTIDPDAWLITAHGFADKASGDSANVSTLEERVVRNGARVAVARTRAFP